MSASMSRGEQIDYTTEYIQKTFVDKGMCADWSIHDKKMCIRDRCKYYADVAQLAEQLICNQQVIGSSPIIGFVPKGTDIIMDL